MTASGPPVVTVDGVSVPRRLRDVHLTLSAGAWALVGANGAGKSSLLDVLAGRLRARRGRVSIAGAPPRSLMARRVRAYVPQRGILPGRLRVDEVLVAAAHARGCGIDGVHEVVGRMELGTVLAQPLRRLSGGWAQRVVLAAGLIGAPRVWLLDEPAAALDDDGFALLTRWTADHVASGGTVLASAHRAEEIAALAPRTVTVVAGSIPRSIPGSISGTQGTADVT